MPAAWRLYCLGASLHYKGAGRSRLKMSAAWRLYRLGVSLHYKGAGRSRLKKRRRQKTCLRRRGDVFGRGSGQLELTGVELIIAALLLQQLLMAALLHDLAVFQ